MLEIIAGATLGTVVAVAVAGVQQRRRQVQTRLVRPAAFERALHKTLTQEGVNDLRCSICDHPIHESEAKIIFRQRNGSRGVVCNETTCLLTYMRGTTADHEASLHSSPANAA